MQNAKALRTLHTEVVGALQLAIAGRAPESLVEELAAIVGLLEALSSLPPHGMVPAVLKRATQGLASWTAWQQSHARLVTPA